MIQFNLLPDVKLQFIRAQRLKRIVSIVAIAVTAFSVFILFLFLSIVRLQTNHISNLDGDIKEVRKELEETPDLNKILTIQNQLNNVTPLHEKKFILSRMKQYTAQVTPTQISYAEVKVNTVENTIIFSGATDSLKTVNEFIDTLKFTKYKVGGSDEKNAFSDVVMSDFGRDDKGASFEVTLKYDPAIFALHVDEASEEARKPMLTPELVVPSTITTRSVTERPDEALFQPLSNPEEEEDE